MDRKNILEKHLLSRCYDSEGIISELLETRYSHGGDQKPILIFRSRGSSENDGKKSLLHRETTTKSQSVSVERRKTARVELRNYIKQTTTNQKKLVKKVQAYNRTKTSHSKPFPIDSMLIHYKIPRYEDFSNLGGLWQKYMQDLLFPNGVVPTLGTILPKLSSADYTGCLLTVIQSKNTNLIGVRGFVVCDAQFSFILCVPRNEDSKEWNESKTNFSPSEMIGGFRMVSKKGTLFAFDVILPKNVENEGNTEKNENEEDDDEEEEECIGFTLIGSRFEFRSVDRSGKKFKGHTADDII
ncbi:rRNA and tRNA processing [Scheffersomyces xylosifermentans]|uniref:rRNA and tRNA processing n=1 Tax=Scheffersomyces xylosifermentans TaxID=1304137 RepID=UPI00315CC144